MRQYPPNLYPAVVSMPGVLVRSFYSGHELDRRTFRRFEVVNEALLDYVEKGSDFEKAGAVNALYWGGMRLCFDDYKRGLTIENAAPESRAAYLELKDVWLRKRFLFLREFVSNENVDVRRSIIPSLTLEESAYPDALKTLVAQAIEIARNHEDDYIRHRVEVQLGNERLLRPLPHRDSP